MLYETRSSVMAASASITRFILKAEKGLEIFSIKVTSYNENYVSKRQGSDPRNRRSKYKGDSSRFKTRKKITK